MLVAAFSARYADLPVARAGQMQSMVRYKLWHLAEKLANSLMDMRSQPRSDGTNKILKKDQPECSEKE